jgi:hypothetical protein
MGIKGKRALIAALGGVPVSGALDAEAARGQNMVLDANPLVYWAMEEVAQGLTSHDDGTFETELGAQDLVAGLARNFGRLLRKLLTALRPLVAVVAFDGPPPVAKIVQQRGRRGRPSGGEVYSKSGDLLLTMSWMSPASGILVEVDKVAKDVLNQYRGANKGATTVYLGPKIPGEGEHKIFEALRALDKEGALPKRALQVIANDNDLIFLVAAHLANYGPKERPRAYLFQPADSKADGYLPEDAGDYRFWDMGALYKDLVKAEDRETGRAHMAHLIHLTCLYGNDFVPMLPGADAGSGREEKMAALVARLYALYRKGATGGLAPWIVLGKKGVEFNHARAAEMYRVANETEVSGTLGAHLQGPADRAMATLAAGNGFAPAKAQALATVAAYEWVVMAEWVVRYYMASTTGVGWGSAPPPDAWYGLHHPPPGTIYLAKAAHARAHFMAAPGWRGQPGQRGQPAQRGEKERTLASIARAVRDLSPMDLDPGLDLAPAGEAWPTFSAHAFAIYPLWAPGSPEVASPFAFSAANTLIDVAYDPKAGEGPDRRIFDRESANPGLLTKELYDLCVALGPEEEVPRPLVHKGKPGEPDAEQPEAADAWTPNAL